MGRTVRDGLRRTAEQTQFVELAREFAAEEIRPRARAVDEADTESPLDVWEKASELGLTTFMIPEKFGGGGVADLTTQVLVQQELCHGDIGIGNLITSNGFFSAPIEHLGTPEQQERFLAPLGTRVPPLTAAASIRTSARRDGDSYVLNGQKTWISNAPYAAMFVIFATVDPSLRSRGVTAFVVPRDTPGLSVGPPFPKMGQRAIVNAEVFLDDVRVPAENRLGEEGRMRTFDASRILIGAACTGLARAALDFATAYAAERVQFGVPIARHQAVAFRLADMATRVDAAHLLTLRAAALYDSGEAVSQESAMAKLVGSENAMWCTHAAVQTLGGYGYSREYPVERWMRDAKLEEIEEGTSDIQRLVISRGLGAR
jgi:alkylation response protein AidB-like acyl-CoA dehydrogenase